MTISTQLYTKATKELEEKVKEELKVQDPTLEVAKAILNDEEKRTDISDSTGNNRVGIDGGNRQSCESSSP